MEIIKAYTPDTITTAGGTFPVEYSISVDSLTAFYTVPGNETPCTVRVNESDPDYSAARAAALEADKAWQARRAAGKRHSAPETVAEEKPAQDSGRPAEAREASQTAEDHSLITAENHSSRPAAGLSDTHAREGAGTAAPAAAPVKDFIGQSISGNGWKILFDGCRNRTRIIFDATPTEAARAELAAAGFYYSAALNSWNKKLTFRAYRAAKLLAGALSTLYA